MNALADLLVVGDRDVEEVRNVLSRVATGRRLATADVCTTVVLGAEDAADTPRLTELCRAHGSRIVRGAGASFAAHANAVVQRTEGEFLVLLVATHIGGVADVGSALESLKHGNADAAVVRAVTPARPGSSVATARPLGVDDWQLTDSASGVSSGFLVVRRAALLSIGGLDERYGTELVTLDLILRLLATDGRVLAARVEPPLRQRPPGTAQLRDVEVLARTWSLRAATARTVRETLEGDHLRAPTRGHNIVRRSRSIYRNRRWGNALSPTYRQASPASWERLARQVPPRRSSGDGPDVLYLLPALATYGGVISVLQLVNRLCLRGVRAAVATWGSIDLAGADEVLVHRPIIVGHRERLRELVGPPGVLVTTSWDTVYDALLLRQVWGSPLVSFVQDYEADFYGPDGSARGAAAHSLRLVEHKIVKTRWLEQRIGDTGGNVHRIPLGLNLDVFWSPPPASRDPVVVCASRPGVPVRNLDGSLEMLRQVRRRVPEAQVTFFGRGFEASGLEAHHTGPLSQRGVAELLRTASVLLDASHFQAFGRPGIEAMACGTGGVLTEVGGINEYARHERNCLQIDPHDAFAGAEAVERMLRDPDLRERLTHAGRETAGQYDAEDEARYTMSLLGTLA